MKRKLLYLFLLIATVSCVSRVSWADSIIPLNGTGIVTINNQTFLNVQGFSELGIWGNLPVDVYFGTTGVPWNPGSGYMFIENYQGGIELIGRFKGAAWNGSLFTATFYAFQTLQNGVWTSGANPFPGFRVTLVENINISQPWNGLLGTSTIQSGQLDLAPVPEPTTTGLFVLGVGAILTKIKGGWIKR